MNGSGPQLILVLVLVAINAALTGTELALVSLRESQVKRLEESGGRRGRTLAQLTRDPNQFLATIQIGITLAGFLASATAAVSLAELLEGPLSFLGAAARPVSIVVVTLILAYFTLVFGELAPKRLAMQNTERWGLLAARPLAVMSTITRPIVWVLSRSTDLVVRLVGGNPDAGAVEMSAEEVRGIIAEHATFSPDQREIIEGALEAAERTLRQVLHPRADVVAVDGAMTCQEAALLLAEAGHSRAPVTAAGQDLDGVIGTVHVRDLVARPDEPVAVHTRPALFLPESVQVLDALRRMQADRQQLCLVVNEHGGTEGLVSLEDLVEELVGEIYDESDRDILTVRRLPGGSFVLPGRYPVHDLEDVGVTIPEGEYTTVAGAVLDELGHIPEGPGERVALGDWSAEVLTVEGHAITAVRLSPRRAARS
ncbi:MAG: hemolysin family protein [Acidimicrobiales bacterium]